MISSHSSPLDKPIFEGEKIIEIFVEDHHNPEEILKVLEPKIMEIRGDSGSTLSLVVKTESGNTVISGGVKEGFHGVWMS